MGVGGGFWEMLRPVAHKEEGLQWLRDKKLAIDLSYWVIQQQTATKGSKVRKPHLRLLFFRTINLLAKIGALPIFVVDGDAPPQKLQARLERFSRISGFSSDIYFNNTSTDGQNIARNIVFTQNIEECVELLKLLGMPVLRAKYEAESLCAELDREGLVDACVTPDSDAFLYGAKCVIKHLQVDFKEPLVEFYKSSDIESVLGLHREHLVALALLAGCDYNMHGVPGIGCNNGMRLVRTLPEEDVLNQLRAWGEGNFQFACATDKLSCSLSEIEKMEADGSRKEIEMINLKRGLHCSYCGHPGTKKLHAKHGCKACEPDCSVDANKQACRKKAPGFKCTCEICIKESRRKMQLKQEGWRLKLCKKISATNGFPDEHIIQIYLKSGCSYLTDEQQNLHTLLWQYPQMEDLECFLAHHLYWDKVYVRQKVLPLLSRICLQELASTANNPFNTLLPSKGLINGLYAPRSVERVKVLYSNRLYRIRWEQACDKQEDWLGLKLIQSPNMKRTDNDGSSMDMEEMCIDVDIEAETDRLSFTTDEDMTLVKAACPELVLKFEQAQDARAMNKIKSKRKKGQNTSPMKKQLNITSFFKAKKDMRCEDLPYDRTEQVVRNGDLVAIQGLRMSEDMTEIVFVDDDLASNANNCQAAITNEDVGISANKEFPWSESDERVKDRSLEADISVAEYSLIGFDYTPDSRSHCLEKKSGRKSEKTRPASRVSVRRSLFQP